MEDPPLAHVDWSYSTANLYEECPRRFFFRHQQSPSETDGLAETSSIESTHPPGPRVGSVVHDCIEFQIERWWKDEPMSLQQAQRTATEALQQYVSDHEDYLRTVTGPDDEQFQPDEFARSLIRTCHAHLETFFQVIWPQFDTHRYILHEETDNFDVAGHTVWVRPDLCTRNSDGDFIITDWKTSRPTPFQDPTLQVLTYALWAHQEYEPELDRILVQRVHTKRGDFDRTRPESGDINQIVAQIKTDRDDWTSFESQEDYQPDPDPEKCRHCEYVPICEAGQEILNT